MAPCLRTSRCQIWFLLLLFIFQTSVAFCYQYKVGDLGSWNIPTYANPNAYVKWSNNHNFTIGDSLLFLYPPSQDSVIQVTQESYKSCNLKDPILELKDGNSLFNITKPGNFYFTSGVDGHCKKSQKLHIFVAGNGSYEEDSPPASGPSAAASPSYPNVFGSIPMQEAAAAPSSSSGLIQVPVLMPAAIGIFFCL